MKSFLFSMAFLVTGQAFASFPAALSIESYGGQNNFSFVMQGTKAAEDQSSALYRVSWSVNGQPRGCDLKLTWSYPATMAVELRNCYKGNTPSPGVRRGTAQFDGSRYQGSYNANDGVYSISF